MTHKTTHHENNPTGKNVADFRVYGAGYDEAGHRVDVDTVVRLTDLSRWVLEVVTEQKYIQDGTAEAELTAGDTEAYEGEQHHPFVVDAEEISEELLEKTLKGGPISPELARTMSPLGPED